MATCDMVAGCANPVTHIGEKGYVYCKTCAPHRAGWERVRRMSAWELRLIEAGEPLPSYKPITLSEARKVLSESALQAIA